MFVKKKGDWAIVAINPAGLDAAPADPTALLGGTEKKYDLAVQILLKNVPSAFKQMAIGQLSLGMERGMQRQPNESDEDYALRSKVTKQTVEQITAMIDDLDRIVVGLSIDSEAKNAYVDFEVTAKPGSKTAEQFALVKNAKTNFAGFTPPEAIATANWVGTLSKTDIARAKANIGNLRVKIAKELGNQGLSDDEVAKAKQLVDSLVDVILETIEAGQVDGGLAAILRTQRRHVRGRRRRGRRGQAGQGAPRSGPDRRRREPRSRQGHQARRRDARGHQAPHAVDSRPAVR